MNKENMLLKVKKYRYPLLILLLGLVLLLLPSSEHQKEIHTDPQSALAAILSDTQGIGKAQVLISDTGVVVACSGAANAAVRLDIIRAVCSYTGFGSDKITILKLRN